MYNYERIKVGDISAEAFRIAADWWFDKIVGKDQYKDNGDVGFHSTFAGMMGAKLAEMNPVKDTNSKRQEWLDALKKHAADELDRRAEVYLHVDYNPCATLRYMLADTNINHNRLPIKTAMRIAFDERGDGVWLKYGYGAEWEYVCDLSGKPPTKRTVVRYLSISPEFKGHDGTVYPESSHEQEFHAYNEERLNQFLNKEGWDSPPATNESYSNSYKTYISQSEQVMTEGRWV